MAARREKPETPMGWLARHLKPKQNKTGEPTIKTKAQLAIPRPQTAPSTCTSRRPPRVVAVEPPLTRPRNKPPPRPPRPDSSIIRDVNAWLDASMIKPAPPLMGGLPYWREGAFSAAPLADVRYAIPIIKTPDDDRPSTSQSQIKSFCRRAKKMHVRMPSLLRTRSQRVTVARQKQNNRRSNSMPLLVVPNERPPSPQIRPLARSRSLMNLVGRSTPATVSSQGSGWIRTYPRIFAGEHQPGRDSLASARFGEPELNMERRVHAVFGSSARVGDTMRLRTAGYHIPREDSMGNLSDAPTYFSGPPPPSYRSRAASILTTSSFGCIDGMNSEQRQLSRQQAARCRGMKGRFKKLAQKARFAK